MSFFTGQPAQWQQQSLLGPEQQGLYQQLLGAGRGSGAGGAFGTAADYYRNNLNSSMDQLYPFQDLAAPELRRFNEETIPGIAEQFAGMGSGALSSGGFQNAAAGAGADLGERLGAMRAQLRQQMHQLQQNSAQGLLGIGQAGLGRFNENIYQPATPGFLDYAGQGLGGALGTALGGPLGAALGSSLGGSL